MTIAPTVLVVEDEVFIRMVAADTLIDAGFNVLEAGDAAEAVQVLADEADISVLFTDVNMPGQMDGVDLAYHALSARPTIGVIITSGASWAGDNRLPPEGQFLAKPYSDRDLVHLATKQACPR